MKGTITVTIAVLSALLGGGAVLAYYEMRQQGQQAEPVTSLSDHLTIIRLLDSGDIRGGIRFLTTLADADVMRLMKAQESRERDSEFRRKVLTSYGEFRRKNPQFYGVPDYVDASGRSEYEENLRNIQKFLDQAKASRPRAQ